MVGRVRTKIVREKGSFRWDRGVEEPEARAESRNHRKRRPEIYVLSVSQVVDPCLSLDPENPPRTDIWFLL